MSISKNAFANPQTYSLHCLAKEAKYGVIVASDSDVEVAPNYLREVAAPLLKPGIAMATCLYRGKNVGDFWSKQTAMLMSVEEPAGALVANLLEGMKFGLGPTIAVRKEALEQIGSINGHRASWPRPAARSNGNPRDLRKSALAWGEQILRDGPHRQQHHQEAGQPADGAGESGRLQPRP